MSGHMTDEQYKSAVKAVWSATIILSIVTVVEVVVALAVGHILPKIILNSFFVLASVAKAFFIVGEFMHLKYEKRAFMLTLGVPLAFLVWAIIALAVEGHYWNILNYPK
ncbi:MAG: cytochrome C oxidase subunit IV family protein [Chitinophagales bacterium]|nr:cytochrome C oxidase subunit IV family protein [Chitinophagales bacterium]HMV15439.1 cytochrome C oxidase subunit IV family protein [Chitinophagales bacterium]HMW12886.1 cytochrome C oxidase subunit IV family protein [Chitinophagales bacterium]HMX59080.1 cytochrome C oxidase subunit IV family protein [Chitinophagales bacterium]HMY22908.1 cytochrome C oxidase subunit IV family protein [Chitinophagales bacterium]